MTKLFTNRRETRQSGKSTRRLATAHEVARLAGVSQSAVSRCFSEGTSVSDATRERVMKAAKRLGYRPNFIARSLTTGRSQIIGVVVPGMANSFYAALIDSLSIALSNLGYRLMLFTARHGDYADPVIEEILRYRLDALVLVSAELSSRLAEQCEDIGLPVVMVNRKTDSNAISSVTGSNRSGAQKIAAFLLAGGHRRFAYLAGLDSSSTNRDRETGFREQLLEAGLPRPLRANGNYTVEGAAMAARKLLSASGRPDAVFCANDQMALVALEVARSEFNLDVGREISIVGFDNTDISSWPSFELTTFSQSTGGMVDCTISIISNRLKDRSSQAASIVVDGNLIVRRSARIPEFGITNLNGQDIWNPR